MRKPIAHKKVFETERLLLREFDLDDADFILKLVNTPPWLTYIGDKNVRTVDDARKYLTDGPIKSYEVNGFGLWLVELKGSGAPIGMCGLLKREALDDIDIGYALLPEFFGVGYALEMAEETMRFAKTVLNLDRVIAIVNADNVASIILLNKLGLAFERTIELAPGDPVQLFSPRAV